MLTYLSCLYVPEEKEIPKVELISRSEDCLAFRSREELAQGLCRVAAKTGRGMMSFEVDIYLSDPVTGLHEGRLRRGSMQPYKPAKDSSLETKSQYGTLHEKFVSGATVRVDKPFRAGSILKLELEDGDGVTEVRRAEVLWDRKLPGGQYEVRLSYQEA